MKRTSVVCAAVALCVAFSSYAARQKTIGEKAYIEVTVGGERLERWVSPVELCEYDKGGNVVHKKTPEMEEWWEYDANGKITRYKRDDGYEKIYKYDSRGNEIYFKDTDGSELFHEYDGKGNRIRTKHSDGTVELYTYDSKGNKIRYKKDAVDRWGSARNEESFYEYNKNGNVIREKGNRYAHNRFEIWNEEYEILYEYDGKGKCVRIKDGDKETAMEYDNSDRLSHKKSGSEEYWWEYDAAGNVTAYKKHWTEFAPYEEDNENLEQTEIRKYDAGNRVVFYSLVVKGRDGYSTTYDKNESISYEYDASGKLAHTKTESGEFWFEYTQNGDITVRTQYVSD